MPTLHWIGKDKVVNHHQEVPFRVLERKYSFDEKGQHTQDNHSENMIIQGDNLEALKALMPVYEGKIKCIYIDPPYNTGNEKWIYNDSVNDPRILKWLGQVVGTEGDDLTRHDKWLCMMYPRLRLLQRLLSDDGFIFVSIDVFEFARLKLILDEIFGATNFRNCISVRRGIKNVQAQFENVQALSLGHEYIFLYSKNPLAKLPKLSKRFDIEKNGKWDTFWRGTDRPTMRYELFGNRPQSGQWRWEEGRASIAVRNYQVYEEMHSDTFALDDYYVEHLLATNEKLDFVRQNESGTIQYYVPPQSSKLLSDNWMDILLSGSQTDFETEKSVLLLNRIVGWIADDGEVVLDSFAGSGTTAHAVLNLNKQDGGKRKFILIEMMDYADSITAERVKRVIRGYGEGNKDLEGTGGSFSYYDLGEPLLNADDTLNENVDIEKIRAYVWHTETRIPYRAPESSAHQHWLGRNMGTDYYFNYEKDRTTTLSLEYLGTIRETAEHYVIYADINALSEEELLRHSISFKKIPRDIARI